MEPRKVEPILDDINLIIRLLSEGTTLHKLEEDICLAAYYRASLAVSIWASVLSGKYEPADAEMDVQALELSDGLRDACFDYWESSQPDYSADDIYGGEPQ